MLLDHLHIVSTEEDKFSRDRIGHYFRDFFELVLIKYNFGIISNCQASDLCTIIRGK